MGAAVSMYRITPPRSQPIQPRSQPKPSPVTPVPNRPTKKCHHLAIQCWKCKESQTVAYPLAVTFWKFNCTSCGMAYSIEIVGNRKCLVFDQLGRKTVERIGLTNERSTYYRAKCYACGTAIMAGQEEIGQIKSCHHCHMDFSLRALQNEIYYETVVQHQGHPVTFRDKVQSLEGYIIQKDNMFFLDDDIVEGSPRALVETLRSLENEVVMLRDQEETSKTTLLQKHAEKTDLNKRLKQQLDKAAELTLRLQTMEKNAQVWETEKRTYAERMSGYGALVQDLDQKREVSIRLESKVETLNRAMHTLNNEKLQLLSKLADHTELLDVAEKAKEKMVALQQANTLLQTQQKQLAEEQTQLKQQNRLLVARIDHYVDQLRDLDRQTERAEKFEAMYTEAATKAKRLLEENHQLANRLTGHHHVLRDLDRQTKRVVQLETLYMETEAKTKTLMEENQNVVDRLTGHSDVLRDLDLKMEKITQLERLNRGLKREKDILQEKNSAFAEQIQVDKTLAQQWEQEKKRSMALDSAHRKSIQKMERVLGENRLLNTLLQTQGNQVASLEKQLQQLGKATTNNAQLENRLRTLQQENERLASKVQAQAHLKTRITELQAEIGALQQHEAGKSSRGNTYEEPKEDWYCEEGEESCISPKEKGYQERRILGLKGEPTPKHIKSALRRRIKKYHPDRVDTMGVELRALAHRKTQEITHAYTQLMQMYAHG